MTDLNTYFDSVSGQSKFPCSLGSLGGFVNFRNSGQRGSVKEFTLSLESILSGLKDIRSNLKEFSSMTRYVEKEWRDSGSKYFTDLILNSMITVQTKPCFTTFSKIINWATEKDFSDYDDNVIDLSPESLNVTIDKIENLALSFSPNEHAKKKRNTNVVKPLEAQLLSKPFLLLAGISGTGKTRFVREQAKTSGQFAETYCLTSVRPDWHEPSDLLGYISRLNGAAEYITTDVLQFIAKAWRAIADSGLTVEVQESDDQGERLIVAGERDALDKVLPYWLCLDEMNLAHVELYFAEFLSKLELRRGRKGNEVPNLEVKLGAGIQHYDLPLGRNVLWAGTMNQDETTKSLSDKVLDRGIVINFPRPITLERRRKLKQLGDQAPLLSRKLWESWWCRESKFNDDQILPFKGFIEDMNTSLSKVGRALGHRVWQSIEYYMSNYPDVLEAQRNNDDVGLDKAMKVAFEDQLVQKVMPKLRGIETRGKSRSDCLDKIRTQLVNGDYTIIDDFDLACEFGYGQFIWNSANYLKDDEAVNSQENAEN